MKRKYIFTQYNRDYLELCKKLHLNPRTEAKHIWRWAHTVGLDRNIPVYCYKPDIWDRDTHEELLRIEQVGHRVEFIR